MFLKTLLFGKTTEMDKEIKESSNLSNEDLPQIPSQQQQQQQEQQEQQQQKQQQKQEEEEEQQNEMCCVIHSFKAEKVIEEFAENLTTSILNLLDLFKSDVLENVSSKISDEKRRETKDVEEVFKSEVSSLSKWLEESERQIRQSQLSLHSLETDFPTTATTFSSKFRDFRFPSKTTTTTTTTTTTRRRRFASGSDDLRCGKSGLRTSNSAIFEFRNSLQQSESDEELFGNRNSKFWQSEDEDCLRMNSKTSTLETKPNSDLETENDKNEENVEKVNCEIDIKMNSINPSLEIKPDPDSEEEKENLDENLLNISCSNIQLEVYNEKIIQIKEINSPRQDPSDFCAKGDPEIRQIPDGVNDGKTENFNSEIKHDNDEAHFNSDLRNVEDKANFDSEIKTNDDGAVFENQELLSSAVMFEVENKSQNQNEKKFSSENEKAVSSENVAFNLETVVCNEAKPTLNFKDEVDQKFDKLEDQMEAKDSFNLFEKDDCDPGKVSDKPVNSESDRGGKPGDGDNFKVFKTDPVQSGFENEELAEIKGDSKTAPELENEIIDNSIFENAIPVEFHTESKTDSKSTDDSVLENKTTENSGFENSTTDFSGFETQTIQDSGFENGKLVEQYTESKTAINFLKNHPEPNLVENDHLVNQSDGDDVENVSILSRENYLVLSPINQTNESQTSSSSDGITEVEAKIKILEKEILERKEKEKLLNQQLEEAR